MANGEWGHGAEAPESIRHSPFAIRPIREVQTMVETDRFTLSFAEAGAADHARMGGKCASLARMIAAGVRVPAGFAVTTDAYAAHLAGSGLQERIGCLLGAVDVADVAGLMARSARDPGRYRRARPCRARWRRRFGRPTDGSLTAAMTWR